MRKYLWIAIISSVLFALAVQSAPPSSGSTTELAQSECDCSNLKVLQIELRNALRLQQNYRNEIAALRPLTKGESQDAFKRFAEGSAARAGLETIPDSQGPDSFVFTPRGFNMRTYDGVSKEEQCRMSDGTKADFDKVLAAAKCAGIARAIQAHEQVHISKCASVGYLGYIGRLGADMAQEEVEAYGAQIAVLRAEIAKVLERANVHVIVDVNTRLQMPPNPLYTAINIKNDADIALDRASFANELIKLDGEGKQETNGSIEGNCRFNSGMPSTLPVRASLETDGLDVKVHYGVEGTQPSVGMECTVGNKTGYGMSIPVHISGNNTGDFNLPLEDGATKEFDQGTGESAQIMARGGAKMTGKGTIRLVLCNPPK